MHYVYVLRSKLADRHYIGSTADTTTRLKKHNAGGVRSTKPYRPWEMVHVEEYHDKTTARRREIFLKKTARVRKELFAKLDAEPPALSSIG
ncbi:GIY-YIG nuclease family protein [Candidatus Kaiserbacteria bacterium]|nr:GIY-YIG nuclease family protein [Candidatus Kaiserbacteria bacterium]